MVRTKNFTFGGILHVKSFAECDVLPADSSKGDGC